VPVAPNTSLTIDKNKQNKTKQQTKTNKIKQTID
jgi:hypothetical protein